MRETLTSGSTRGEEVVLLGIASSPTLPFWLDDGPLGSYSGPEVRFGAPNPVFGPPIGPAAPEGV